MISKIKSRAAVLSMLTVLTGAVAVNSVSAAKTTVKSGLIADISSETVTPAKVRKFMDTVINANNQKTSHIWLNPHFKNGFVNPLYRFDLASGKTVKIADLAGHVLMATQNNKGVLVSLRSMLISLGRFAIDDNNGYVLANSRLIIINSKGDLLDLADAAKYLPEYPALSPNGTKVAFLGCENSKTIYGLYVMDLNTMSVKQLYVMDLYMMSAGESKTALAWSPDSSEILISKRERYTLNYQIASINVNSEKVVDTVYEGCGIVFSPDGKKLAYSGAFTRMTKLDLVKGVPISGDIFVASYPNGKPEKLSSGKKGAIMPVFSPDGKQLAYFNGIDYELHIVDLNTKHDRKVCRTAMPQNIKWMDNNKIVIFDRSWSSVSVKEIDITKHPADVKHFRPSFLKNTEFRRAITALKPVFALYLAGLEASCTNRLSEASRNYRKAYKKLLKLKDFAPKIDPDLKLESLKSYLVKFKELAEMSERDLYLKELKYRMHLLPLLLNIYIRRNRKLPGTIKEYAKFLSSDDIDYIKAGSKASRCLTLMPDQKLGSKSVFNIKFIDDNNIEFNSGPLPWGGKLQIKAVKESGRWRIGRKDDPSSSKVK